MRVRFRRINAGLLSALTALAAGPILATVSVAAHAWGAEGHQVVALIAQSQLTPKVKAEIAQLLSQEPGETLATISKWADEHKNPATGPWHYVNFPRDSCVYDAERDCPDGQCVVGAVQKELQILGSNAPDDRRLTALKYIVHFIGDVHQPLHAGFQDDRGGNKYQVQAFGKGSNLHALWDSGLIKNLNEDADHMAARLSAMPLPVVAIDMDVVHAAEESCLIVSEPGFYPEHKPGAEYVDRHTGTVEQRLRLAGVRLAGVLNGAFQ
jgi:hypothetical protein